MNENGPNIVLAKAFKTASNAGSYLYKTSKKPEPKEVYYTSTTYLLNFNSGHPQQPPVFTNQGVSHPNTHPVTNTSKSQPDRPLYSQELSNAGPYPNKNPNTRQPGSLLLSLCPTYHWLNWNTTNRPQHQRQTFPPGRDGPPPNTRLTTGYAISSR